jgi:hypothetical protein
MSDPTTEPLLATVFLADLALPTNEVLMPALRRKFPAADFGDEASVGTNTPVMFFDQGSMCTIMRLAAPAPISEEDSCILNAWYWPESWQTLEAHKAHLVVTVSGELDARTRAIQLENLLAATVESVPSMLAVVCASSDGLWSKAAVENIARHNGSKVPTPLFVSVRIGRDDNAKLGDQPLLYARTHGLKTFGLMEVEIAATIKSPVEASATLTAISDYLIQNGPVLEHGDTMSFDGKGTLNIHHANSFFMKDETVHRIDYMQ